MVTEPKKRSTTSMTETAGPIYESFADLEDPNEWNGTHQPAAPVEETGRQTENQSTVGRYKCAGCKGTGKIAVYRKGGGWDQVPTIKKCWKGCGGTGYTKTSPETLAARRQKRVEKKRAAARAKSDSAKAFLEARPDVHAWFRRQEDQGRQFGMELHDKLFKYGHLTTGQLACIERDIERYEAAKAKREAAHAEKNASATLDLSSVPSGYYAVPGGDTRLKIKIDQGTRKWAGWTFVRDGAEYGAGRRYGSQRPGQRYVGDVETELAIIAADPKAASIAYGKLVGRCGVCGRKLEDERSVAAGIGPVCARKF